MKKDGKIKVLIVDDSLTFREALYIGLSSNPNIEVVATAEDAFDARDKIIKYKPDVMTCDVQMPKLNGIDFIKMLMPQYPIPTIVVSTISDVMLDAMLAGAVDFVVKPSTYSKENLIVFYEELVSKIFIAADSKVVRHTPGSLEDTSKEYTEGKIDIIAIGASTGGTEAIDIVLSGLPKQIPGVVIVQHIPKGYSQMFADRLNDSLPLDVKEAQDGDLIKPGSVLIAPGDKHMAVFKSPEGYRVKCYKGEKINWHCPSVDVLFDSVSMAAKDRAIGVILTGMGNDGANGLLKMRANGAHTIGQDEHSSVVYGMPKVAYEIGAVEVQAPLLNISKEILKII
ncbi:MAG: chemotaxis response regulator protein-glutamate methylesterase [Eubacteriales bacterium]|nr:chemotaxis response regulator protein-glutamate methylesterase [Eubacteriales bacterium]